MIAVQCFPVYKPSALQRLINRSINAGAEILLDVEDGIKDVRCPGNDNLLKANAFKALIEMKDFLQDISNYHPVHIRINGPGTIFFKEEIKTLANLGNIKWASVFVPKVESAEHLAQTFRELIAARVNFQSLAPIIESGRGVDFLFSDFPVGIYPINNIFFGNYDYNLSCNNWPITEQNSFAYWKFIAPLIEKTEDMGYVFGNSPYALLKDLQGFGFILKQLEQICNRETQQVTLNLEQSKLCRNPSVFNDFYHPFPLHAAAVNIKFNYEQFKLCNRSFALLPVAGSIITPHEYLLSINQTTG